eukprot:gene16239-22407_t
MVDAAAQAEALKEAMAGWGALVEIVLAHSNDELQAIRAAYEAAYGTKLIDDIKSECSGAFEDALCGLLYTPAECDAFFLGKAIEGAGTDEEVIIQHLCHRSSDELDAVEAAYEAMFGKTLKDAIEGDCPGDAKTLFLALVNNRRIEEAPTEEVMGPICETLYEAGENKWGTDEKTFIDILTTREPSFIAELDMEYGRRYGKTLQAIAEEETGGVVGKCLDAMLSEHDGFYAYLIKQSMEGAGSDDDKLVRILTSRRNKLTAINTAFMDKYTESISRRVKSETSGDLKKLCLRGGGQYRLRLPSF